MKEFQYTIKDACGIHARPAGLLVKTVKGFASSATLEKDGKSCDMRKLMALMGMDAAGILNSVLKFLHNHFLLT